MLSREETIREYDFQTWRVVPDRLKRGRHPRYPAHAERMLQIYRTGIGRRRCELHAAVEAVFGEEECDPRCIRAFQKLLDDGGEFERSRGEARALRHRVFAAAKEAYPLVREGPHFYGGRESEVKARLAQELGKSWEEVETEMFSDLDDFRRLVRFEGYAAGPDLLARYNVAQTQAALYDAVELRVWTGPKTDLKTIVRQIKWAELVHSIARRTDGVEGYEFVLDGPASMADHTRRYGWRMALFLPALLLCEDWRMEARLRRPGEKEARFRLCLSPESRLHGHLTPPGEFDSAVERAFFEKWGGEAVERQGWRLRREGTVLERLQHLFTPDFTFTHGESGRTVLFEIVGYWREDYRRHKLDTLARFGAEEVIWAVREDFYEEFRSRGAICFSFKATLKLQAVLDGLAQTAANSKDGAEG